MRGKLTWKRLAWWAALAGLMAWTVHVVLRSQSPGELIAAMGRLRAEYLLLAVGLMGVYLCSEALCTAQILKTLGSPMPLRRCLGYSCAGFYFSTVTPSATGGQPMQVYYMARDGVPGAHGALDMLLVTICFQVVSAGYALVSFLYFPNLVEGLGGGLGVLLGLGLAMTLFLTALMVACLIQPRWMAVPAMGIIDLLSRVAGEDRAALWRGRVQRQLDNYGQGAAILRSKPTLIPRLLGLTTVQLGALYLVPYMMYLGFGLTGHTAAQMVAMQAMLSVAVAFLPLPGGMGAAESVFLQAFGLFFGADLVAPAMVLSRGVSCYGTLALTGAATLALHLHRRRGNAKGEVIPLDIAA